MNSEVGMILFLLSILCSVTEPVDVQALVQDDLTFLTNIQILDSLLAINQTRQRWFWFTEEDVQFWLFTRKNPFSYQVLMINDSTSLMESNFAFDKKVKVVVHGWVSNGTNFVPQIIKDAYLISTDSNIIIVDWSKGANRKYLFASYYVAMVGRLLTDFLKFLVDEGVSTDDIHLIGHSLGAHVVGIAGRYYELKRQPIDAITGLDPAYPLYKFASEDARLDKTDARHVEVIHTCGGFLGYPSPLGHIDYYPNGGRNQPGCGYDIRGVCAHDRAVEYFTESLITADILLPFTAIKCENYDELNNNGYCNGTDRKTINLTGLDPNYREEGVYYFKTKSRPPFAMGDPSNWNNGQYK